MSPESRPSAPSAPLKFVAQLYLDRTAATDPLSQRLPEGMTAADLKEGVKMLNDLVGAYEKSYQTAISAILSEQGVQLIENRPDLAELHARIGVTAQTAIGKKTAPLNEEVL